MRVTTTGRYIAYRGKPLELEKPLDDTDGAACVLDPVFRHLNSGGAWQQHGFFFKDFEVSSW